MYVTSCQTASDPITDAGWSPSTRRSDGTNAVTTNIPMLAMSSTFTAGVNGPGPNDACTM